MSLARRFSAALEKVLDHLLTVGFSITNPLTLLSNASLRSRLHIPQPLFKISSLTAAAQKMALPSMPLPLPGYKGHSETYRTHKLVSIRRIQCNSFAQGSVQDVLIVGAAEDVFRHSRLWNGAGGRSTKAANSRRQPRQRTALSTSTQTMSLSEEYFCVVLRRLSGQVNCRRWPERLDLQAVQGDVSCRRPMSLSRSDLDGSCQPS